MLAGGNGDGHFNLSIRSFEHARSTLDLKSQLASKKSGEQLVALARGAVRGKPPENLDRRPVLVKVCWESSESQ